MTTYLDIFKEITQIPRPSHHEGKMADFLCSFAEARGLAHRRDAHDNVVIEKPATPGYEAHEPLVLLNHMDMVCVADAGKAYNALTDSITAVTEDGWMTADGTSLGADNGMGLAMALAVLDSDTIAHPHLEVLTTTNEEDGMTGAQGLAPGFIKGHRVINLDSEDYDKTTVASAGAVIQEATLPYSKIAMPEKYMAYSLSVTGGRGGHSGVDINKGRANAIKVLANLLLVAIRQCDIKLYLVSFNGGQSTASIPSEAEAKIVIPLENAADMQQLVAQCNYAVVKQFAETDPEVIIHATPSVWHSTVFSEESTQVLLASLNAVPVGPLQIMPDEVTPMTSNNIGIVKMNPLSNDRNALITFHTRSFVDSEARRIASEICKIMQLSGATVKTVMEAPAWQETDTTLADTVAETFKEKLGFSPEPVTRHFVLEAGYLVQKFPGLHIASIGPRILNAHTVNERVELSTCEGIWKVLTALLPKL